MILFLRNGFARLAGRLNAGARRFVKLLRKAIIHASIRGRGIEIGALHRPLPLPPSVRVTYVDRFPVSVLRTHYPELGHKPLVEAGVLDDGETLAAFQDASQDFVIANHFLEHCENPVKALENMFRVLKKNGVLYLTVPDKRFTFDSRRELTSLAHFIDDYRNGPEHSRKKHYEEWARKATNSRGEEEIREKARKLLEMNYSIHFHTWTASSLKVFLKTVRKKFSFRFRIWLFVRFGSEVVAVLQKTGESRPAARITPAEPRPPRFRPAFPERSAF